MYMYDFKYDSKFKLASHNEALDCLNSERKATLSSIQGLWVPCS